MATIYVSNFKKDRQRLWLNLANCIEKNKGSWLLGGDFNCIRFQDEKMGNKLILASKLLSFNTLIETYGLFDLKITGARWT